MTPHEKIKIIRQLNKMSQTEFGESMGLTKATISNLETDRVPIPKYLIVLLREIYNIDPDWLMDDSQSDFEKCYLNNSSKKGQERYAAFEKFKQLKLQYQLFILSSINELLSLQEQEENSTESDKQPK